MIDRSASVSAAMGVRAFLDRGNCRLVVDEANEEAAESDINDENKEESDEKDDAREVG